MNKKVGNNRMQFAIAEKFHEKYLEDVAMEISQDSLWRKRLFEGQYHEQFLATYKELEELPCQLWTIFSQYGLEFLVSKVQSCPETFDENLTIFKFQAKGFSHLVRYSGNGRNNFE
ncbi:hypothetical protein LMF89_15885 [Pelosinus sp. Bkl1]|uniref:Uncharacterized protein n=2 Tax=Pelosinus baikalensis TaxID=2892015 RepID=A0ABS8HV53_9FIRM|nr:hypothetical protein [Pelosinus baikalensis]